jgi:putative GTP pyrophosphokinase
MENELKFLQLYENLEKTLFKPTLLKVRRTIEEMETYQFWFENQVHSSGPFIIPVQRTRVRLKRPESIVDKIKRKPSDYPRGLTRYSLLHMNDVVGSRIIVYTLNDLPILDKIIRNSRYFELVEDDPPEAYVSNIFTKPMELDDFEVITKSSGYVSLHYTCKFRVKELDGLKPMRFEIQLRTLAENTWAEIEHGFGYKPEEENDVVRVQFKLISNMLYAIDSSIAEMASSLQASQQNAERTPINDSAQLNSISLPAVLKNESNLICNRRDINILLNKLASRGIQDVGALRLALRSRRYGLIGKIYRQQMKRDPTTFEIVACLPSILTASNDRVAKNSIEAQITYGRTWREIKDQDEFV